MMFRDRTEAGQRLAPHLMRYRDQHPLVLGLPRGGVPVALEIARALAAPLDVFVVRKLGAPFQPELGVGAVSEDGMVWLGPLATQLGIAEETLVEIVARERAEAARRVQRFRHGRTLEGIRGRTVILVDDGIATGGTVHAAARALRARGPARLVLAVPVASPDALESLRPEFDEVVCLSAPEDLMAIGYWYRDFRQVEDDEVVACLEQAQHAPPALPTRERIARIGRVSPSPSRRS